MASENYVALTGMVPEEVNITVVDGVKQASFKLFTLRKRMRTLAGEDETDIINVFTRDSELISQIKKLHPTEIVSVIGNFCSVDVPKTFCCENSECSAHGVPVEYKGSISYINPIEIMPIAWAPEITPIDAKLWLHKYREHSNTARIIGSACGGAKHIPLEVLNKKSGAKELLHLWQLRVRVKRHKLVANSLSNTDFISVNSYEELPEVKSGDFIAINGFVKSKIYTKNRKCPCCGKDIKTTDTSLSIVPYTIEHIRRMEEE